MTISRSAALNYINPQFEDFASMIGQKSLSDLPNGYRPDIDNALRELGFEESALTTAAVEDTKRRAYFTLVEYFAARRMWIRASAMSNVKLGPRSEDFSKNIDAIKAIMDDAAARAAGLGYSLSAESEWEYASWASGSIEPRTGLF